MNQRGSMNQRTDEIERILNASKVNYSSPQVSQQPTLYEVQRRYAEDLKQLRQQFEESQQKQEIKDREQAKEIGQISELPFCLLSWRLFPQQLAVHLSLFPSLPC